MGSGLGQGWWVVRVGVGCGGVYGLIGSVDVHVALDIGHGVAVLEPLVPHRGDRGLLRQHACEGRGLGVGGG